MGLFSKFRELETKYALTFVGCVLALVFGIPTIYTTFFQKTKPGLRFEVLSSANVFDINEDVGKLDVLFNGINLREKQQTLALATVKISNDGVAPILKSAYDENAPVGVEVSGGEIAKAELLRASNSYLATNLNFRSISTSVAVFSPVIIEPGDAFWVKVLVLHKEKTAIDVKATGKVAGIKEIAVVGPTGKEARPLTAQQSPFLILNLRSFLLRFLSLVLLVVVISLFGEPAILFWRRARRKAKLATFPSKLNESRSKYEWLTTLYIRGGKAPILSIYHLLQNPQKAFELGDCWAVSPIDDAAAYQIRNRAVQLIKLNLVKRMQDKIVIDQSFRDFVEEFARIICGKDSIQELKYEFPY